MYTVIGAGENFNMTLKGIGQNTPGSFQGQTTTLFLVSSCLVPPIRPYAFTVMSGFKIKFIILG